MNNVHEIGGKAASLEALKDLVNVKPFITITVAEIQALRRNAGMTAELRARLEALPSDRTYAVRSSAVGEDSNDVSWAGQFQTTLNVPYHQLVSEVAKLALIYDPETVRAYANAHGADAGELALIVQEMVDAKCAGVLFTRDPRNGIHMLVESCEGTADALVSGHLTPTRYYLDPGNGNVVRREGPDRGALSNRELLELCGVVRRLKAQAEKELDIEWAFDKNGTLYINQSRPITGLQHVVDYAATTIMHTNAVLFDEHYRLAHYGIHTRADVLSDQNIVELLTPHPTPMAHGLFCHLFAHGDGAIRRGRNAMGYEIGEELCKGFHMLVGGQPRVSILHDALTYRIKGITLQDYALMVDDYLGQVAEDSTLANYPEVNLYHQNPTLEYLVGRFGTEKAHRYAEAYRRFFEEIRALEGTLHKTVTDEFLPHWREIMQSAYEESSRADLSRQEAIAQYRNVCGLLRDRACFMFVQVARLGFFAYSRSRDQLIHAFGKEEGEKYHNVLLSTTTIESPNYRFSASLYSVRANLASLEEVIDHFGHLGKHELEISLPRYREQPDILRMLADKTIAPDVRTNVGDAQKLEQHLITQHPGLWSDLHHDIEMARTYLEQREIVKFEYLKGYDVLRQLACRIERMMGWPHGLIFYLEPADVFVLTLDDPVRLMELALYRRSEQKRAAGLRIPAVLYADRLADIGRPISIGAETVLRGIGVTNQITEGTCVVVKDLSDTATLALLGPGSILVAVNTDPAWSPVIAALGPSGGLITEVGGVLAHAAICAREIGTAAVLNVADATQILKTGMRVRVNGPASVVEILS